MVFSWTCIILGALGALGVVGGIWLARDKRAASVAGGVVIALLSLVPILFGAVLLAYMASP
ncbi:hypothetical protein [Frigoribacterium sp. CFBP 8751]|uniref:hypothetical protein n=1 Tax=Frigoribacterium sp. CFBP 8751 TaxID=2775277 RepID=UPI001782C7EE|nr:hypothetical protein [Frigoribacterium sp. CFBP 8751]MBD8539196.1 hypothetical protein [Frigoribacterium sp. CFBP 8751]